MIKKKIKVAFQGEKGAYSHLACLNIFPDADAQPCKTFDQVFKLAKENSEYKIVIPITNSSTGSIADMHYLLPKYKLQIHAEHFQKVSHNLLGIKGSKITDIIKWGCRVEFIAQPVQTRNRADLTLSFRSFSP